MVSRPEINNTRNLKIHANNCVDSGQFININCKYCKKNEIEKSIKNLGIPLDKNIKWKTHTNIVKSKLNILNFKCM